MGIAAVLASLSDDGAAEQRFVFEEGIGPVTVTVDGPAIRFRLRLPRYETTGETPSAPAIAKALTLPEDAIIESWYGGAGLRFCFVRLADRELVDRFLLSGDRIPEPLTVEAGIPDVGVGPRAATQAAD